MDSDPSSTVFLVDASIYIFRAYFSLPDHWHSDAGMPTSAVYGYGRWLMKLLDQQQPLNIAVCFDESLASCFRNALYPAYKSSRSLPDDTLAFQLHACKKLTELMGIACYASFRFEADDLLATLANRCRKKALRVCVVSRDKDLGQLLLGEEDWMWDFPDGPAITREGVFQKLGVYPAQIADYLALVGDPGDDIPGVVGLGPKTAAALLSAFGSWQSIKSNFGKVADLPIRGAARVGDRLAAAREQVDLAVQLTRTVTKAPLGRRFKITRGPVDRAALTRYCLALGLGAGFSTSVNRIFG